MNCIYFVRAATTGYIKIGFTKDITTRIAAMQGQSGDFLELLIHVNGATRVEERALHKRFAEARVYGEWFEPTPALLEEVERLRGPFGPAGPLYSVGVARLFQAERRE